MLTCETVDKDLKAVGLELMFLTPEKCSHEDGVTAVELAKMVGLPVDVVKKKLVILKDKEIVQVKGINPKYWKMGYGKKVLQLGLEESKTLIEDDKILITCDDDNVGSYKIIESNGGILENKVENEDAGEKFLTRRYWIKK